MDAFGIINMNGRVYDPLTAQFFSPDPQLQDPGNWLNYNRYGYCIGNPLKYTDPSGEAFGADDLILLYAAVILSAKEGFDAYDAGGNFWGAFAESFVPAAITTAFSVAIPFGIGQACDNIGLSSFWNAVIRAGAPVRTDISIIN